MESNLYMGVYNWDEFIFEQGLGDLMEAGADPEKVWEAWPMKTSTKSRLAYDIYMDGAIAGELADLDKKDIVNDI